VRAIVDIVFLEVNLTVQQTGSYSCPYGTKFLPHPLVSLVSCHVDIWRVLLMEVERVFHAAPPRLCPFLLVMLQPFFKHLILDAHAVSSSSSLRASSYTSLSQIADTLLLRANREIKEQDKADLLDSVIKLTTFMVKSLSFLQTNSLSQLTDAILNFKLVAHWFLESSLSGILNIKDLILI
jgi:hypothetical protein